MRRLRRIFGVIIGLVLVVAVGFAVPPVAAHADATSGNLEFRKVDLTGALLPGAEFEAYSCTKLNNDPDWTCTSLNTYTWFRDALKNTGTTGQAFGNQMDQDGGWDLPVGHCVVVREVSPPEGYLPQGGTAVVCRGPGGWTVENAADVAIPLPSGEVVRGSDGGWQITNDPVAPCPRC